MAEEAPAPEWRPFGVRGTEREVEYAALAEGVPPWLEGSLWRWAMDRGVRTPHLVYDAERFLRLTIGPPKAGRNPFADYWGRASEDEKLALLDFFLHDIDRYAAQLLHDPRNQHLAVNANVQAYDLEIALAEGGSAWRVAFEPYWCLARRVDETTQALAERVSAPKTDAARKVASAWNACYRQGPDYDRAFRDAVLAVEALVLPLAIPNDPTGTLGKAVVHIADTVNRWSVGGLEADQQPSGETLLSMLRTLWHNQERHARGDGTIRDVGKEEAEVAVSLAVTLVHWFSSGLVTKASAGR